MTKTRVIPLAAMAGLLLLAYVLDKISVSVKDFMSRNFLIYQGYFWLTLFEFLFAGMAILLVWLALTRSKRSFLVGAIFVAVGLICLLFSTFFRFRLSSIVPLHYVNLYRYQLQDLPFFQRIFATLFWNIGHGHYWWAQISPLRFQFFTKASVLIVLLGLVKFFQKPEQASSTT